VLIPYGADLREALISYDTDLLIRRLRGWERQSSPARSSKRARYGNLGVRVGEPTK
jgi:hypothetical protein